MVGRTNTKCYLDCKLSRQRRTQTSSWHTVFHGCVMYTYIQFTSMCQTFRPRSREITQHEPQTQWLRQEIKHEYMRCSSGEKPTCGSLQRSKRSARVVSMVSTLSSGTCLLANKQTIPHVTKNTARLRRYFRRPPFVWWSTFSDSWTFKKLTNTHWQWQWTGIYKLKITKNGFVDETRTLTYNRPWIWHISFQ